MNNENGSFIICPNCGAQNKERNILCIKCGFNFHVYRKQMNIKEEPERDYLEEKRNNIKSNIMLGVSLLNIGLIFPFVVKYSFLWKMIGETSKYPKYYYLYLLASGYALASIAAVLSLVLNFIFRGKIYRFVLVMVAIFFTVGIIAAIVVKKFNLI
ncbi:MAG: zinc-ribbon domain-containing protein [Bacilli bacterium]|nr:zinc-ribbon domain-containing protein [Bacilli bacterium]